MLCFRQAVSILIKQSSSLLSKNKIRTIIPSILAMMVPTFALAQNDYSTHYPHPVFNTTAIDLLNTPQIKDNAQIDWSIMATAHSPVQPIAAFIGDWDAPLDSGDYAYLQGRADLRLRPAGSAFSYGLGWRYDYLMSFSEETAEVYWQYQNKKPSTTSQSYPLFLEAKHNERFGANIGFTQSLNPNWQLTSYANIWQGLHALEGSIVGNLTTKELANNGGGKIKDSVDKTHAYIDYYYDKPVLGEDNLNWNPAQPSGYGYSLDMQLTGQLSASTQVILSGYDILGRMHWQDMPSTRYALDYDANGRPLYNIEGQLSTKNITQTLPWRMEGSVVHQLDNQWQVGIHGQVNDIQDLYQLSAGYRLDDYPIVITGLIEPQTKSLGMAIDSKYGGVKLLTDDLDSEKAKCSEISLYGRYAW